MRALAYLVNPQTYFRGVRDIPRLLLAAIFLSAAFNKNLDPEFFLKALQQYHHIPFVHLTWVGYLVVIGIIVVEYATGLCAAFGLVPRLTVIAALAMNVMFVTGMALHWGEKFDLGCGCFGRGEMVVNLAAFWKNFLLLLITLGAGAVAFRAWPERARADESEPPDPEETPAD